MGRKKKPLASPSKAVKTKAKRLVSVSEESKQCDQNEMAPVVIKRGRGRPRKVRKEDDFITIMKSVNLNEIVYFPSDENIKEEIVESELSIGDDIVGVIEVIEDSSSYDAEKQEYNQFIKTENIDDYIELESSAKATSIQEEYVSEPSCEEPVHIEVEPVAEDQSPPSFHDMKFEVIEPVVKSEQHSPVRNRFTSFHTSNLRLKQEDQQLEDSTLKLVNQFNQLFDMAVATKTGAKPISLNDQNITALTDQATDTTVLSEIKNHNLNGTSILDENGLKNDHIEEENQIPITVESKPIDAEVKMEVSDSILLTAEPNSITQQSLDNLVVVKNENVIEAMNKYDNIYDEMSLDKFIPSPENIKKEEKEMLSNVNICLDQDLDKNEGINDLLPARRRSNRIKSITSKKKSSAGHGLVKKRDLNPNPMPKQLVVEVKKEPAPIISLPPPKIEPFMYSTNSAVKVKSRWRLTSELEMGIISDVTAATAALVGNAITVPTASITVPKDVSEVTKTKNELEQEARMQKDMTDRLSQFITIKENEYLCERNINKETRKMVCDCFLTKEDVDRDELGCGEDCLNRLLMIECGSRCTIADRCTNKRFQKNQYAHCEVFRTEKKGFGIQAVNEIHRGDFIMEYVGEVLNGEQFDDRATEYSREKNKHYYFMLLKSDAVIDATLKGNISRFINHSCDPNAETQKWTVNGELRIGFFSTKHISPGEEITFDYQFQRYGKQAQKCYCESAKCRGWIGEEPSDGSDEEIDENEDEEDSDKKDDNKACRNEKKDDNDLLNKPVKVSSSESSKTNSAKGLVNAKQIKAKSRLDKGTKKVARPKKPQKLSDDVDLYEEIELLMGQNLKNQAQTLQLCRLMVRAKDITARSRLINILQSGEFSCRRLFLDYHGLRLLAGWLADSILTDTVSNMKFRIELIELFEMLPITNKTILKDSKILQTIEKFAVNKVASNEVFSPNESSNGSSNSSHINSEVQTEKTNNNHPNNSSKVELDTELLKNIPNIIKQSSAFVEELGVDKLKQIINNCDKLKDKEKEKVEKAKYEHFANEEIPEKFEDEMKELEYKIFRLSNKILSSWVALKEVFRIPKKERIEQMKEHEREADMVYKTAEVREAEIKPPVLDKRYIADRYRENNIRKSIEVRDGSSYTSGARNPNSNNANNMKAKYSHLDKFTRRHLFEIQEAKKQERKMKKELWNLHNLNCMKFDLNPHSVLPTDVPAMMNPYTGQYFSADHRHVSTPPIHKLFSKNLPPFPTNPEDYDLPELKLPEHWKFAISKQGKIYYYQIKDRVPQWEPPIIPLEEQKHQKGQKNFSLDSCDDSSTTDTCDSSEEESKKDLRNLIKIRRKRKQSFRGKLHRRPYPFAKSADTNNIADRDISFNSTKSSSRSKKKSKRVGLVRAKIISPRTDEDRLYGQAEMKRYRETKEKLRRRKEEMKMAAAKLNNINRYKENLDNSFAGETSSEHILNTSLITKIPIVDELDILSINPNAISVAPTNRKQTNVYVEWKKVEAKRNLEKKKQQAEAAIANSSSKPASSKKRRVSVDVSENNSEAIRKIKDKFVVDIAGVIVLHLGNYMKDSCKIGRITNNDDFKHLAKKLSHFVMVKETRHLNNNITQLVVTESVKSKAREFIKKYMAKYGAVYQRGNNEPDYQNTF